MGRLYTRSRIVLLEDLMLRQVGRWCGIMRKQRHVRDLSWACRALEADIVCKMCLFSCLNAIQTLTDVAEFSFGTSIRALDALDQGLWLDMVAMNDEKARWMPVVSPRLKCMDTLIKLSSWWTSQEWLKLCHWSKTVLQGLVGEQPWLMDSTSFQRYEHLCTPTIP